MSHVITRAKERISPAITDDILADLRIALDRPARWADYIEHVMPAKNGAHIWRFRVAEGIFYVVAKGARPVTILTAKQVRGQKRMARAKRQRPAWYQPLQSATDKA